MVGPEGSAQFIGGNALAKSAQNAVADRQEGRVVVGYPAGNRQVARNHLGGGVRPDRPEFQPGGVRSFADHPIGLREGDGDVPQGHVGADLHVDAVARAQDVHPLHPHVFGRADGETDAGGRFEPQILDPDAQRVIQAQAMGQPSAGGMRTAADDDRFRRRSAVEITDRRRRFRSVLSRIDADFVARLQIVPGQHGGQGRQGRVRSQAGVVRGAGRGREHAVGDRIVVDVVDDAAVVDGEIALRLVGPSQLFHALDLPAHGRHRRIRRRVPGAGAGQGRIRRNRPPIGAAIGRNLDVDVVDSRGERRAAREPPQRRGAARLAALIVVQQHERAVRGRPAGESRAAIHAEIGPVAVGNGFGAERRGRISRIDQRRGFRVDHEVAAGRNVAPAGAAGMQIAALQIGEFRIRFERMKVAAAGTLPGLQLRHAALRHAE